MVLRLLTGIPKIAKKGWKQKRIDALAKTKKEYKAEKKKLSKD